MLSTISTSEIQQLIDTVNAGDISSAYDYLTQRGYDYASWANGVAQNNTIAGVSAVNYLTDTAQGDGQILTSETIQSVKHDMAINYLDILKEQAKENGGITAEDINGKDTWDIHKKAFQDNNLSIENWTLNAPLEIVQKLYGDKGVESIWETIRKHMGSDSI